MPDREPPSETLVSRGLKACHCPPETRSYYDEHGEKCYECHGYRPRRPSSDGQPRPADREPFVMGDVSRIRPGDVAVVMRRESGGEKQARYDVSRVDERGRVWCRYRNFPEKDLTDRLLEVIHRR